MVSIQFRWSKGLAPNPLKSSPWRVPGALDPAQVPSDAQLALRAQGRHTSDILRRHQPRRRSMRSTKLAALSVRGPVLEPIAQRIAGDAHPNYMDL